MPASDLRHRLHLLFKRMESWFGPRRRGQSPTVLVDDEDLLVSYLPGTGAKAVVVFAGMATALGKRTPMEFVGLAAGQGGPVLFISDLRRSWYSYPGLKEKIQRAVTGFCAQHGVAELCTIGNSMGGYGAILFAGLLPNVRHVAAFAPQVLLTAPVLAMPQWEDSRPFITSDVVEDLVPGMLSSAVHYTIVYGDQDLDDQIHTAHLPKAANIDMLVLPGCDHKVARWLKSKGVLAELGAAMLKGQPEVIDQFRQSLNRSAAILAA